MRDFGNKVQSFGAFIGDFKLPSDPLILQFGLAVSVHLFGEVNIEVFNPGQDVYTFVQILRKIGIKISCCDNKKIVINAGGFGSITEPNNLIDCGRSKIALYLLCGMLSSYPFFSSLNIDDALMNFDKIHEINLMLAKMGINLFAKKLPISFMGNQYAVPLELKIKDSSFYIKAMLLMLASNIKGETTIIEPFDGSYDHLENLLQYFGFQLNVLQEKDQRIIKLSGREELYAKNLSIPAEVEKVNFLVAAALLVEGSKITINNVCINPKRVKILELFMSIGAKIEFTNVNQAFGEKVADVCVKHSSLQGFSIKEAEFAVHELPLIILVAACAKGETIIQKKVFGSKFSSFIVKNTVLYFKKAGVVIDVDDEKIIIKGTNYELKGGISVNCFDDQIIAMTFMVCGFVAKDPVYIYNYESDLFRVFNNRN